MPWNFHGWLPTWRQTAGFSTVFAIAITLGTVSCRGRLPEKAASPQRTANKPVLAENSDSGVFSLASGAALRRFSAKAERASGATMLICAWGDTAAEGTADSTGAGRRERDGASPLDVAHWLQDLGVEAFVVEPPSAKFDDANNADHDSLALEILKSALRQIRQHARAWKVDTARIGVFGLGEASRFAAKLAYRTDDGNLEDAGSIRRMDSRPQFMVLGNPHFAKTEGLLGKMKAGHLWELVDSTWPPLLVFSSEDSLSESRLIAGLWAAAYQAQKRPVRSYQYPARPLRQGEGEHANSNLPWAADCALWLKEMGFAPNLPLEEERPE